MEMQPEENGCLEVIGRLLFGALVVIGALVLLL